MENIETRKPHSAEYFGDYRNFWWNIDFLQLMAQRLKFDDVKKVLDLGCGVGHWGQILSSVLPAEVELIGVDREAQWTKKATDSAKKANLKNYTYQIGDINHLNFADNTFGLVTCQTVLIHVADVKIALKEMLRVTKTGGLILAVEPNNLINWLLLSSLSEKESVENIINIVRFALICERGKEALNLGCNSIGDLVPGFMAELGIENIQVHISDKASPIFPPYAGEEQEALINQTLDWKEKEFWIWDRAETKQYYIAGGGDPALFDSSWKEAVNTGNIRDAIDENQFHAAGGSLMYLISGRKLSY